MFGLLKESVNNRHVIPPIKNQAKASPESSSEKKPPVPSKGTSPKSMNVDQAPNDHNQPKWMATMANSLEGLALTTKPSPSLIPKEQTQAVVVDDATIAAKSNRTQNRAQQQDKTASPNNQEKRKAE